MYLHNFFFLLRYNNCFHFFSKPRLQRPGGASRALLLCVLQFSYKRPGLGMNQVSSLQVQSSKGINGRFWEIAHLPFPYPKMILPKERSKCQCKVRGGVGRQFPRNDYWSLQSVTKILLYALGVLVTQRICPPWFSGKKCARVWRQVSEDSGFWPVTLRVHHECLSRYENKKTADQMDVTGSHSWSSFHAGERRVSLNITLADSASSPAASSPSFPAV